MTATTGIEPTAVPAAPGVARTSNGSEKRKERGVVLRVLVYVVAAHLLAFYLWLMFAVIGKR
ncbi:DUF6126 family protein [Actinacidiphila sp. ITFR-21]|uniref:DUF6126 family protein n=1 Tax=Actinacidiphila sp. ITFR-21 TaxID=3075199 RepID=UPI0028895771|nr:DUF6126 family protein [Streptomyces sp. ITFR-21]WNI14138.1 DUF6126 family protein [Streptomyces sp. ITFR-21]